MRRTQPTIGPDLYQTTVQDSRLRSRLDPDRSIKNRRSRALAATLILILLACGESSRPPTPGQGTPPTTIPSTSATPAALTCGVERLPVKTLSDADFARITLAPSRTTIRALNQHPAHCNGGPNSSRPYPEELQAFAVTGRILLARLEDDHDYHVALADPDSGDTIVAEVPHPDCASPFSPGTLALQEARLQFEAFRAGRALASLQGQIVSVNGVGFYDSDHRQKGRARNCLELHPVLSIQAAAR
jgi:hypothetical protein